jgi:hypothetical protein
MIDGKICGVGYGEMGEIGMFAVDDVDVGR